MVTHFPFKVVVFASNVIWDFLAHLQVGNMVPPGLQIFPFHTTVLEMGHQLLHGWYGTREENWGTCCSWIQAFFYNHTEAWEKEAASMAGLRS